MKINHIGVAVRCIEEAFNEYSGCGYEIEGTIHTDNDRRIRVAYINNGGYRIELVSPISEDIPSPVDRFIGKSKSYEMYHVCYEVENLDRSIDNLKKQGYILMEKPSESVAMGNNRTTYLYNSKMGLVELVECRNNEQSGEKRDG